MLKPSKVSVIILLGLVLSVLWRWLSGTLSKTNNPQTKMTITNENTLKKAREIFELVKSFGFPTRQAQIITAQAGHETGNFASEIYLENHNLFGYKYVGQAGALGEKNGHALYASDADSVKDFERYYRLKRYLPFYVTIDSYVLDLKKNGYFEADIMQYLRGVTYFDNLYFPKNG